MIPALAFNDANAPIHTDPLMVGEALAAASRKLNEYSSLTRELDFESKCSFITINELSIVSGSANGVICEVEGIAAFDLLIPLSGYNRTTIDGVEYSFNAHKTALLGIYEKHRTFSVGCVAALHLRPFKITETYSAILGSHGPPVLPTNSQVVSMEYAGISFLELFKCLFAKIDVTASDQNVLSKLALDDSFYRLCVGLIYPDIFLATDTRNGKRPYVRPELTRLCEYIAAHLTESISLTVMEQMSGLSARILQRSFQRTYGLTPNHWLRKQRLHAARAALQRCNEPISITAISYDFCFASPSEFARYYCQEFGELPSQTLKRARRFSAP